MKLSPGRVAQSMLALAEFVRAGSPLMERTQALIDIGTPAQPPQSRGKSNGRANGFKCTPRTRDPVARKTYSRPKKPQKKPDRCSCLVLSIAQRFHSAGFDSG